MTSETGERVIDRNEMPQIKSDVGRRIVEAFAYAPDREIALLLKTSRAEVEAITEGSELPSPEILLSVYRTTGVSIHWLLTGEGSIRPDYRTSFSAAEEPAIFGLA